MITATTLHRTKDGWKLAAGPDKRADKQRYEFNNIGANWPKDVIEIRYQPSHGPAKTRSQEKAEALAAQTVNAEKKAAEKIKLAEKQEEERKAAEAKKIEAKKKAEVEAREREVKAKEDAKRAPK